MFGSMRAILHSHHDYHYHDDLDGHWIHSNVLDDWNNRGDHFHNLHDDYNNHFYLHDDYNNHFVMVMMIIANISTFLMIVTILAIISRFLLLQLSKGNEHVCERK